MSDNAAQVAPVYINFTDRPRRLRFSIKSLARMERELKCSIDHIRDYMRGDSERGLATRIIDILWYGVIADDPDLKRNQVEDLLPDDMTFDDLVGLVTQQIIGGPKNAPPPEEGGN